MSLQTIVPRPAVGSTIRRPLERRGAAISRRRVLGVLQAVMPASRRVRRVRREADA
ncbi:hypothetical protein [Solimonas terrae]|uniref:Uncharacterized protein n=1 Tax=Solimonas terrae TaxID=1396819 RepID=A0A6M2BNB0_9GAMM|nr:hypothetical protein [Solimonas terrae]NGY03938.1 hypothetical protein [Solimonas terrae]